MTITAERNIYGAWVISAMIGGYRVHKQYYWCTKREAIALFKEEHA